MCLRVYMYVSKLNNDTYMYMHAYSYTYIHSDTHVTSQNINPYIIYTSRCSEFIMIIFINLPRLLKSAFTCVFYNRYLRIRIWNAFDEIFFRDLFQKSHLFNFSHFLQHSASARWNSRYIIWWAVWNAQHGKALS